MRKTIPWNTGTGNIILDYTGEGDDTVSVSSDANNLKQVRSQILTFKTSGNEVTRQVTVVQAAKVPVVVEGSFSGHPVSYDADTTQWYSATGSFDNAYTDADSANYLNIYLTRGSNAVTYMALNFDTSEIPANATIKSVTCEAKAYMSNTQSNRVATRKIQLYSGSTAKGTAYNMISSTTKFKITAGDWTREELDNVKIVINCVRGTNQTSNNYYVRFYGATLTVEYEYEE